MLKIISHRFLALAIASVLLMGLMAINIASGRSFLGVQEVYGNNQPSPKIGGAGVEGFTAEEEANLTDTQKRAEEMAQVEGFTAEEEAKLTQNERNMESEGLGAGESTFFEVDSVSKCQSEEIKIGDELKQITPSNCFFLEEPIGGKPGYDLYTEICTTTVTESGEGETAKKTSATKCVTALWHGKPVPEGARGPIQALLSRDPDKPYQGPFGLLYSYLGLVYSYMSGLIVGLVVLFIVVGGIQMITSAGQEDKYRAGKERIVKALIGMVLWFTASLILYTINPTFFAF